MANWFDQFDTGAKAPSTPSAPDDDVSSWFDQFDQPSLPTREQEFGTPRTPGTPTPAPSLTYEQEIGTAPDLTKLFGGRATVAEPSQKERRRSQRFATRTSDRQGVTQPLLESRPLTPTAQGYAFQDQAPATFGESVGRGVDMMQSMVYGALEVAGEVRKGLPGLDERSRKAADGLAQLGREGRLRNEAEIQGGPARSTFGAIRSAGDFAQWAKETIGEQIPIMGPMMAGGAAGAAVGSVVPGVGTTIGGLIGAFVPAWTLGVGETQGAIKDADPTQERPGWALAGGTAVAALDSALPGMIGSNLVRTLGKEAAEKAAKWFLLRPAKNMAVRGAQGAVVGLSTEGVTEALQEAISGVTGAVATGTPIPETLGEEMFEAGAAGGLLGAATAGVAALPAAPVDTPPDVTPPTVEGRSGTIPAPPHEIVPDQAPSDGADGADA